MFTFINVHSNWHKVINLFILLIAIATMLLLKSQPKAYAQTTSTPTLELITDVVGAYHSEAMEILDSTPHEIVFSTVWPNATCGQGNAEMWKLELDPTTGDFVSVAKKQTLTALQVTRGIVAHPPFTAPTF